MSNMHVGKMLSYLQHFGEAQLKSEFELIENAGKNWFYSNPHTMPCTGSLGQDKELPFKETKPNQV